MASTSCGGEPTVAGKRWQSFDKVYSRRAYKRPRVDDGASPASVDLRFKGGDTARRVKFQVSDWSNIEIRGLRRRLTAELGRVRDVIESVEPTTVVESVPTPLDGALRSGTPPAEVVVVQDAVFVSGTGASSVEVISPGTPAGGPQTVPSPIPESPAVILNTSASPPEVAAQLMEIDMATEAETSCTQKEGKDVEMAEDQSVPMDTDVEVHRHDGHVLVEAPAEVPPETVISNPETMGADAVETVAEHPEMVSFDALEIVAEHPEIVNADSVETVVEHQGMESASADVVETVAEHSVRESADAVETVAKHPETVSTDAVRTVAEHSEMVSTDAVRTVAEHPEMVSTDAVKTVAEHPEMVSADDGGTVAEHLEMESADAVETVAERLEMESSDAVETVADRLEMESSDAVETVIELAEPPEIVSADAVETVNKRPELVSADTVKTVAEHPEMVGTAVVESIADPPEIEAEMETTSHGQEVVMSRAETRTGELVVLQEEVHQMASTTLVANVDSETKAEDDLPKMVMETENIEPVLSGTLGDLKEKSENGPAKTQEDEALLVVLTEKVEFGELQPPEKICVVTESVSHDVARTTLLVDTETVSPDITRTEMQIDEPQMISTSKETTVFGTTTPMEVEVDKRLMDTIGLETAASPMEMQVDQSQMTTSTDAMAPDASVSMATQAHLSQSSSSMVENTAEDVIVLQETPLRLPKITISLAETTSSADPMSPAMEKEKRTPKANQFYRNSEFILGKDKLRLNQESNKKSKSSGNGSRQPAVLDRPTAHAFKQCLNLVTRLIKHRFGWVFDKPVDVVGLGLLDYYEIIKYPMDLGTVKSRLNKNWYRLPGEFAADVRLTFHNAITYNPENQDVHLMAKQLLGIFEEKWAEIQLEFSRNRRLESNYGVGPPTYSMKTTKTQPPPPEPRRSYDYSEPLYTPPQRKAQTVTLTPSVRFVAPKKPKANDQNKRDMTYQEKQKLTDNLLALPLEKQEHVIQVMQRRNKVNHQDDGVEVDIESFDAETLWELDRLVSNYKKSLSKIRRKAEMARGKKDSLYHNMNPGPAYAEAQEVKRAGANGASHSLPGRGETNGSAGKLSSSSSSSSDSDSSSSDSDSNTSSGSDGEHPQKA